MSIEARLFGLSPRILFALGALVYVAVGLHYTGGLQAAGDEPHYLLMAQSLWKEHDLDLRDNLERQDFLDYAPAPLAPHYGQPRKDGRPFPSHSPGLPLLLAPLYAAGGRRACVVFLALAAAALALESRALLRRFTDDRRALFFAWAIAAGPPVAYYAFHVYTEVVCALLLAFALRQILSEPGPFRAMAAAAAVSFLPWLHVKMTPAAAALGVVALVRLRGRPRLVFMVVAVLAAAGFAAYYQSVFGQPTPLALFGGVPHETEDASPVRAAMGLLFDRSFGLVPHAPVFVIALAGALLIAARWREAWPHLLVAAAIVAPLLVWRMWWGGMCPPGRFLVPLVPCLAVAAGVRLADSRAGLSRGAAALWAWGVGLTLFMAWDPERALFLNRRSNPTRVWAALPGSLDRYLPSLVDGAPSELRVALVWTVLLVLLVAVDVWARRRAGTPG